MATQAAVLTHELPGEFGAPHPSGDRLFRDVTFGFHPGVWHQRLEDLVSKHGKKRLQRLALIADGTVLTDADAETADVYVSPYQTDTPGRKGLTPLGLAAYLSNGKVDKSCYPLCWEKDFEADRNTPPVQVISGDTRMTALLDRAIAAMRGVENAWTMGHDQHGTIPQERDVHHTVLYPATKWYLPDGDWTSLDLTRAACQRLRVALADTKHKFLRHTWLLRCLDNGRLQRPAPDDYLSPEEVQRVVNRCDPHSLRPFDIVKAPNLLHTVLKWPAAVTAPITPGNKTKITYPEALAALGRVTPQLLPETYRDHRQYQDLMLPMLIHESWEEVRSSIQQWPQKEKTAQTAFITDATALPDGKNSRDDIVPDVVLLDADYVKVYIRIPNPRPCEFIDEERKLYNGKDILMFGPPAKPNYEASSKDVVLAQITHYNRKNNILTLNVLKEASGNLRTGTEIKFDMCFRLTTTLRQLSALQDMARLEPWVLRIWLDPTSYPLPSVPAQEALQTSMTNHGLNHSQAVALETALSSPLTLIHGPPATGKTRTIAALISRTFPTSRKILLCAPSNLAVDHVMAQLRDLLDHDSYTEVVRLGDRSKILPALLERSARKLAVDSLVLQLGDNIKKLRPDELARKISQEESFMLEGARVICTTPAGAQNVADRFKSQWDAIIIDQATQATEPAALGPLFGVSKSTKVIMVGDPRILGPGVSNHVKTYGYGQSFWERLDRAVPGISRLLNIQYRMSQSLADIPNRFFYVNKLVTPAHLNEPASWHQESLLDKFVWIDVTVGTEEVKKTGPPSRFRHQEVAATAALLRHFAPFRSPDSPPSIGVASMYSAQADLMRTMLARYTGVDFHTVDAYHGKEKDIIILSLVRCGGHLGFVDEWGRINAAITLAKKSLWIVGSLSTFEGEPVWSYITKKAVDTARVFKFDEQTMTFR